MCVSLQMRFNIEISEFQLNLRMQSELAICKGMAQFGWYANLKSIVDTDLKLFNYSI